MTCNCHPVYHELGTHAPTQGPPLATGSIEVITAGLRGPLVRMFTKKETR